MSHARSDDLSLVLDADPTPDPSSAVTASRAADAASPPSVPRRRADHTTRFLEYCETPPPDLVAIDEATDAAYEAAEALYGDLDGEAACTALLDGTHPLCRLEAQADAG